MTTPPPSPVPDHHAIADLHTAPADGTTPHRHSSAAAVANLVFSTAQKRPPAQGGSSTVPGAKSPQKKRLDGRPSPQRRVCSTRSVPTPMEVDGDVFGELEIDDLQRSVHPNSNAIPRVSLSPQDEPPLRQSIPKASRKKIAPSKLDTSSSRLFTFIRPDVFDTKRFVGKNVLEGTIYTSSEIKANEKMIQKQLLFNFSESRASSKKQSAIARESRSATVDLLDENMTVASGEMANFQDLSRYVLEDIIKCRSGTRFLLCLPIECGDDYNLDLRGLSRCQQTSCNGGERIKMAGKYYYSFKVQIDMCPNHEEIALPSGLSQSQFITMFNNKSGGFRVQFEGNCDGYTSKLFVKWYDVVNSPEKLMFFGLPFSSNRPMAYLFEKKNTIEYAHHIFMHFSQQYFGDSKQSYALYAAYKEQLCNIYAKRAATADADRANIYDKTELLTDEVYVFAKHFDNHCKFAFTHSFTTFQNYTDPLILIEDWENWVAVAKTVMDKQWRILASFRNITSKDTPELVQYKERQIFCQLLSLIRAANFRLLSYWALILSTAYYGWGVRGGAIVASSFWGITVSRQYRDSKYSEWIHVIDAYRKALLGSQRVGLFAFDNVVVVHGLRDQRGRSSSVLTATHMVAHEPTPFLDLSYDYTPDGALRLAELTYNANQPASSPSNMRRYEDFDFTSTTTGTDVFLNHNNIPAVPEPCMTGDRVRMYRHFSRLSNVITSFGTVFRRKEGCYKNVPDSIDDDVIQLMRSMCDNDSAGNLFNSCWNFKQDSVKSWNAVAGNVTKSLMLGVIGIDESSSEGAMTCVLDLLLKYNVLKEEPDGSWSRVQSDEPREMMCFGDRTTNENVAAFILSLQDRPMSLEEASIQAEIFLDAVLDTQFLPGDWHTSMNMLQSIFKVHWSGLLCPLKIMLKWTRVSNDVRGCYYQASKLVTLANRAFTALLIMEFVTEDATYIQECGNIECKADAIVEIAKRFWSAVM